MTGVYMCYTNLPNYGTEAMVEVKTQVASYFTFSSVFAFSMGGPSFAWFGGTGSLYLIPNLPRIVKSV
jgi:hypothetical protein